MATNPNKLKTTTVGDKKVTLSTVPASKARKLQMLLATSVAEPAFKALSNGDIDLSKIEKVTLGEQASIGVKVVSSVLPSLSADAMDELIELASPHIYINGELFDEDAQFDPDTSFQVYEILWFFLKSTLSGFFADALSRFSHLKTSMPTSKK